MQTTDLTEDDLSNLYSMFSAAMGGGIAPVAPEDAKRLEARGLVKLLPAHNEDYVAGEIEPEYTFTLTDEGERKAREYRATWPSFTR